MDERRAMAFPLSGLQIFPEQLSALQSILTELKDSAGAELVLLTDRSGHCISDAGAMSGVDLAALGSLLAGHVASSEEIANLLGDVGDHEVLVREGERYNLFGAVAGTDLLVLAATPRQVPSGWARICALRAVEQLRAVPLERLDMREPAAGDAHAPSLDPAIDQALKELWLDGHVHQLGEE